MAPNEALGADKKAYLAPSHRRVTLRCALGLRTAICLGRAAHHDIENKLWVVVKFCTTVPRRVVNSVLLNSGWGRLVKFWVSTNKLLIIKYM